MTEPQPDSGNDNTRGVTRLAPSPTGALHLGNARSFLINWSMAKRQGWRVVLRIEDLDGPRIKNEADRLAIDLLGWLGMDWDEGPYYQSPDLTPYHAALCGLLEQKRIYPCKCTRKDIMEAQSAPHDDGHELRYPGTCRPGTEEDADGLGGDEILKESHQAWRVIVPEEPVSFEDRLHGLQTVDVHDQVGDFIVASKAGLPAYQLAVVVDDARQGVTQVVRGDDLIRSTGRQLLLYRLLGLGPEPAYTHLPLVLGPDGRRLAKRHGDTRLDSYRARGVSARRVVGLLAYWSGVTGGRCEMDAAAFADAFELGKLGRDPVVFTEEDEAWLLADG